MEKQVKEEIQNLIKEFSLPRYNDIPNVGLYLEQVVKYISEYLSCLGDFTLTRSMISNYVKKDLVANPVKKQYGRDHIAYLFFIAVAKSVLSLEEIQWVIRLQKASYLPEVAYEYFDYRCGRFCWKKPYRSPEKY